jgi:predicted cobalt transporter CbtA
MAETESSSHAAAREARALRARLALGVRILTSAGYAMVGGAVFRPLTEDHALTVWGVLWGVGGAVALGLALVLAPDAEPPDD